MALLVQQTRWQMLSLDVMLILILMWHFLRCLLLSFLFLMIFVKLLLLIQIWE
uniref:Uncharacterized protein n=1 Tax=Arundo donax TaxID=35708 RepID=A0A0A9BGI7_ARUDO